MTGRPLRILITGSRQWRDPDVIREALTDALNRHWVSGRSVLVHGDCPTGADRIAEEEWRKLDAVGPRGPKTGPPPGWWVAGLTFERHPARWGVHGRAAGPIRNAEMVALGADVVLAFPIGPSPGTRGCIDLAEQAGIPVVVHEGTTP